MKFAIRDIVWATVVVALVIALCMSEWQKYQLANEASTLRTLLHEKTDILLEQLRACNKYLPKGAVFQRNRDGEMEIVIYD